MGWVELQAVEHVYLIVFLILERNTRMPSAKRGRAPSGQRKSLGEQEEWVDGSSSSQNCDLKEPWLERGMKSGPVNVTDL